MKKLLLPLICLLIWQSLAAQNFPKMKLISSGTVILGGGYQFSIQDYYMVLLGEDATYAKMTEGKTLIGEVPAENNPTRRVSISSFYLSETEVTNAQYQDFMIDSLFPAAEAKAIRAKIKAANEARARSLAWKPVIAKAAEFALLPDTNCWVTDFVFASNEPLVKNYLWHPAFADYPVVGVSWVQAKAYCAWLSARDRAERVRKQEPTRPDFRLPTEAEWEYAAREYTPTENQVPISSQYPWHGNSMLDEKGHYRANIKTGPGDYISDNYEYTAPCKSFAPNSKGLYCMAGNVSEWCEDVFRVQNGTASIEESDGLKRNRLFEMANETVSQEKRVVKGGSWAEMSYAAMCGSRMGWPENHGGSRIGFRVARTIAACECGKQNCRHQEL